jgi:hypothetical protein
MQMPPCKSSEVQFPIFPFVGAATVQDLGMQVAAEKVPKLQKDGPDSL